MKGGIGLGLLVGIIGAIFLPFVFLLINNTDAFTILSGSFTELQSPNTIGSGLQTLFGFGFSVRTDFNANFLELLEGGDFMVFLPAMLTWIVCGLLAAMFSQSPKKGIVAAIIFIAVEILLYMLFEVIKGGNIVEFFTDIMPFIGVFLITGVGFSIVGGLVGGFISQFAFGPEEI